MFALAISVLLLTQTTTSVLAWSESVSSYANKSPKQVEHGIVLPEHKQQELETLRLELETLRLELGPSQEEVQFLQKHYLNNHNGIALRWKTSAVKKIIKAAKPILKEAAKKFGIKLAEKSIADLTDYLFEWKISYKKV